MKRVGFLYDKIFTKENFEKAVNDANKHKKRKHPINYKWFEYMKSNPDKCYGHYIPKTIKDTSSLKVRHILIPQFYPDQVFHHMLSNIITPILQKGKYEYSCASIKGKGTLYTSLVLRKFIKKNNKKKLYWFKADIRHFYDNIDHKVLMNKLRTKIKDERVLNLIYGLIKSSGDIGLPLGNYTSQILANFYLTDFDHLIKERYKLNFYERYMDDMLFISTNKRILSKALKSAKLELLNNYKLNTHNDENIYLLCSHHPIDIVGYRHYQKHITIRRRLFVRLRRSWLRHNQKRFTSYYGYLKHSLIKEKKLL